MAFQELMIAPTEAKSFAEGIRLAVEVYSALKAIIADRFGAPGETTKYIHTRTNVTNVLPSNWYW